MRRVVTGLQRKKRASGLDRHDRGQGDVNRAPEGATYESATRALFSARVAAGGVSGALPQEGVLALQRQFGNQACCGLLASLRQSGPGTIQRDITGMAAPLRMTASLIQRDNGRRRRQRRQMNVNIRASDWRAQQFAQNWAIHDPREAASHFPQLGASIFSRPHFSKDRAKVRYMNGGTGWYLELDRSNRYFTVHDGNGNYVDWNGNTSATGAGAQFHFRY